MSLFKMVTREVVVSWVLFAMTETLHKDNVRRLLLQQALQNVDRNIVYGPVFDVVEDNVAGPHVENVVEYVLVQALIQPQGTLVLFTASDLPSESGETHFQAFILDTTNEILWVLDPARAPKGRMIYTSNIEVYLENNLPQGYHKRNLPTSAACQTNERDVFCQSWSLWLQIQAVLRFGQRVVVPTDQRERYALLLSFFQQALMYPQVCNALKTEYLHVLEEYRESVLEGVSRREQPRYIASMKAVDPCQIIMSMLPEEME
jgi:hypothetical protein